MARNFISFHWISTCSTFSSSSIRIWKKQKQNMKRKWKTCMKPFDEQLWFKFISLTNTNDDSSMWYHLALIHRIFEWIFRLTIERWSFRRIMNVATFALEWNCGFDSVKRGHPWQTKCLFVRLWALVFIYNCGILLID